MRRDRWNSVAKRTEYNGVVYASKTEAELAAYLDLLVKNGDVRFWIRQVAFTLGCPENLYRADFLVYTDIRNLFVFEAKGFETDKWKRTKKLWRVYGPCPLHVYKLARGKLQCVEVIEPDDRG